MPFIKRADADGQQQIQCVVVSFLALLSSAHLNLAVTGLMAS